MAGSSPLIVLSGLLQKSKLASSSERVEIERFNVGDMNTIGVSTTTITVDRVFNFLDKTSGGGGNQNLDTINGGSEGDIIILTGDSVRLRNNDNIAISGNILLNNNNTVMLIYDGLQWLHIN